MIKEWIKSVGVENIEAGGLIVLIVIGWIGAIADAWKSCHDNNEKTFRKTIDMADGGRTVRRTIHQPKQIGGRKDGRSKDDIR